MQWQAILPIVQYALFPFFCAAFYFLRLKSYRIPRVALLLALVGGTVSFVELYLPAIGPARAAVMSPLEGDTIQSQSRKLRERINADLHTLGQSQVKGISRRVKNHEEAMKLVGSAGLKALVWGNTRWVRVAFAEQAPASLVEIRDRQEFMSLKEIRLVTSVPSIGLPYEPRNETANFLAGVVGGVSSGFAGSMSTVEAAR